ncbi:hypothetical protein [Roseateles sp. LYH14W]|uniref:HEAT repeat domain-containing protein n=1 Tax=Pelomonas parva TaxID=3299032 RepID=A0ABW7F851_9BURK
MATRRSLAARLRRLLVWASLGAAFQAAACSLLPGYLAPSNYDLVKRAEIILLAKAVAYEPREHDLGVFTFTPEETLKGAAPARRFRVEGAPEIRKPFPSHHFGSLRSWTASGGCNVYDYRVGATYLLFLPHDPKDKVLALSIQMPPYTRINEEVSGPAAPWVMAVRRYVEVSQLGSYERENAALRALQAQARRASPGSPRALVRDIDTHFASPSAYKSFADLMALYEASEQDLPVGQPRRGAISRDDVLWAFANAPHREARPLMLGMIHTGAWVRHADAVADFAVHARDAEVAAALLARFALTADKEQRAAIARVAGLAAAAPHAELVLQAMREASSEEALLFAPWVARHGSPQAIEMLASRVGTAYRDSDDQYESALTLANAGDPGVIDWAGHLVGSSHKRAWVGLYAIARSPLPQADLLARRVVREGQEEDLSALLQGYKESANPNRWNRLADVAALPVRPPKVERWLRSTLVDMAEEGDLRAAELLHRLPPYSPDPD